MNFMQILEKLLAHASCQPLRMKCLIGLISFQLETFELEHNCKAGITIFNEIKAADSAS